MHRYAITIFWSNEDRTYVAAVPELPGCSALGDTYEEALREEQVAMSLWIDTRRSSGIQYQHRPTSVTSSEKHREAADPHSATAIGRKRQQQAPRLGEQVRADSVRALDSRQYLLCGIDQAVRSPGGSLFFLSVGSMFHSLRCRSHCPNVVDGESTRFPEDAQARHADGPVSVAEGISRNRV